MRTFTSLFVGTRAGEPVFHRDVASFDFDFDFDFEISISSSPSHTARITAVFGRNPTSQPCAA
jgi:hypothetical protein